MFDKKSDKESKLKAAIAYENSVMSLSIKEMKIDPYEWDNSNLD